MKRLIVISTILFTGCLFILSAHMEVFAQDSEEIRLLNSLYRIAGIERPSIIYPASGDTIRYFIDSSGLRDHLPSEMRQMLDDLALNFGGDSMLFKKGDLGADLAIPLSLAFQGFIPKPEELAYLRSDGSLFDRLPLISLDFNFAMTDLAFGQFRLDISKRSGTYNNNLDTNLMINSGIMQNLPLAAYLSIGTKNINLFAGRRKVSAGRGITGNMALGDNFLYRDVVKLSLHAFPLSYELLFNSFDPEIDSNCRFGWADSDVFHPQIVIHRISASLFSKLTLTLYEGLLSWSNSGMVDPKLINPFMALHDLFTFFNGKTNNFLGFEADISLPHGLSFHAEGIMDQLQMQKEKGDESNPTKDEPDAFGLLASMQWSGHSGKNMLLLYIESAYTSPSLYLKRDFKQGTDLIHHYQTDLIVGNNQHEDVPDVSYIGYKYGPNTIACESGVEYSSFNDYNAHLTCLFRATGDTGLGRATDKMDSAFAGKLSPWCSVIANKPEYLLQFTVGGRRLFKNGTFSIGADISLQNFWNYRNSKDTGKTITQFSLSASFDPMTLLSSN
ncbi:MAG: hypothetical protein PHO44_04390 [Sphaerochaetaceae bacterium]|nr:hypothetical protein [Sphaerochaetaceae bacterium]